jgi:type I restriction enzyme S subunit
MASVAHHQLGKMLNSATMRGTRRRYLRSVNVRPDGTIELSDVKEMLIPSEELTKYDVQPGDIFVNEGGDVGRSAIWQAESQEPFAFQNQLHRLRPGNGVNGRFLQIVIQDAKFQGAIAQMSSGVTIQHFSARALRRLAVPLPPSDEQVKIVAKVDELMALCNQLESELKTRNDLAGRWAASIVHHIGDAA